jgi:hypothetical protein
MSFKVGTLNPTVSAQLISPLIHFHFQARQIKPFMQNGYQFVMVLHLAQSETLAQGAA